MLALKDPSEKLYSFNNNNLKPNFITKTDSYLMAASYVKKGLGISVLDQILHLL